MSKGSEPICMHCKHLRPKDPEVDGWTCDAYPEGIAKEIITGWAIHNEPFIDDNGIQFEAKES